MKPLSRARAVEVDRIVAGIVDDMASGRWVTGRSHRALATEHGVSVSRVEDWATEAGRLLRVLMLVDREDLRARNAAHLETLAVDAHMAGEFGDAVRARAEMGKLLGLNAPEKVEHAPAQTEWEQLPAAERPAWLRAQAARFLAAAEAAEEELRDAAALPAAALPTE